MEPELTHLRSDDVECVTCWKCCGAQDEDAWIADEGMVCVSCMEKERQNR